MKKLYTTAVVLLAMALALYASNSNTSISHNGDIKPHSQQYQDLMEILDEYGQVFKNAQSCFDYEYSVIMYKSQLSEFIHNVYAEDDRFTQEEVSELNDRLAQLATEVVKLYEQWGDKDCMGLGVSIEREDFEYKIVDGNLVYPTIFQIVEEMPRFPGGEPELMKYINENIQYPQEAREMGIQGRVFVGFVVEYDGSISNVKILRGIGSGCDEEAVRVIESLPKWEPGKQRGRAVRVSYQIPVYFKLTDDTEK